MMKANLRICTLFCLQLAAIAQPAPTQLLQGHLPAAVAHLAPLGRLEPARELKLAIGLPLRDKEGLTNLLQGIYDPTSPDYHHYLTPAQFAERFGPTEEDYRAVTAFAAANGLKVTATHPNRALLDVTGSVSNIEKAFHVTMRSYPHPREKRVFYAPDVEPSLDLAAPVLHISGLDNYLLPHPMSLRRKPLGGSVGAVPANGSGPEGAYMGRDFRAAYVPGLTLTGAGQSVGLLEFDSGFYQSDISAYESLAGLPDVPVKAVLLNGYDGGPGAGNDEVSLDIEMAISMAPGLASVIVYEGDVTDDILNRMATDGVANQLGASWTYGIDAVTDQIFQQFAAQGQSFFNASGDGDAYTADTGIPTPADDPNITSVGGTTLTTSGPGGAWVSETVWNWDVEYGAGYDGEGSSGGISATYPIPAWQLGVSMTANHGSTSFRNIPDVALTADNVFVVFADGQIGSFGGTSCATPLWAAFVALANEQALANGRPTLGFLNPAIYAVGRSANYAYCFHDITTGNNTWSVSPTSFYAVPGYDLCTGWGTPMGSNLVNVLAPLDALQISPLGGWASGGAVGGPLAPASQTYTLTNSGNATLNWAAATTVPWLNVSLSGGTLTPGGAAATVVVSLNAAASNLFLGTYGATLWFTNLTDGAAQSRPFVLTIIKPPVITAQPTGLIVLGGTTATFSVGVAGGLPLNCQWRCNGTNVTNGGRVSGAQLTLSDVGNIYGSGVSTLTISNVAATDGGTYSLVASNAAGAVISSYAVLAITPSAPVIIQQPASQTVLLGASVQFSVAVEGSAPFTYQWMHNETNLTDGVGISGSATPTLTITGASSASIGTYTVVVGNAIGMATSTGAVLTVRVVVPGGQLAQNGGFETGSFSSWSETGNFVACSVSSSSPAVYSGKYGALLGPAGSLGFLSQSLPTLPGQLYLLSLWLDSPDGLSPNEFLVAWNGTVMLAQTNLGAIGWTNLQFYVTATGTNTVLQLGFRDDASFLGLDGIQVTPVVSADGPPVIVTQPANQFAPAGSAATFSVLSSGRFPLSYQWQVNQTNLTDNGRIEGSQSNMLTVANVSTNDAANYQVIVSNVFGSATSAVATLLVESPAATFFTNGAGWRLNGGSTIHNNVLTLTDGNQNEARSAFFSSPVSIGAFTASFTYQARGARQADGVAFVLQNEGATALGGVGGLLGYSGISPSLAIEFNLWTGSPGGVGYSIDADGLTAQNGGPPYSSLGAVNIASGSPINVSLSCNQEEFTMAVSDISGNRFTMSTNLPNLAGILGAGGAFVGFTGGSGGGTAIQTISNFTFFAFISPLPEIIFQPSNQTVSVGGTATFSVAAMGANPLYYSWSRNGSPIAGATNSSYTTNNVQLSDSGSQFSCLVSNANGATNSRAATLTVTTSIVVNGGFETGDLTGWGGSKLGASVTTNSLYVHSGRYGAELGPYGGLGYLSQTLPTVAGSNYWVSLWFDNPSGGTPNEFQVMWNGTVLYDGLNLPAFGWTNLQFVVTATSGSDLLQLGFRQDPIYLGLDDVSVILTNLHPIQATIDHFAWSSILSPEGRSVPFPVTVTAQDVLGNSVTNFASAVTLSAWLAGGWTTNFMLEGASPAASGSGTYTWGYPFTPTNDLVVTALSSYFGTKVSLWASNGTLLASENVSSPSGVWSETPLSAPVSLAAGSSYVVAAYVSGTYNWTGSVSGEFPDGTIGSYSLFSATNAFPTGSTTGAWPLVGLRYTVGSGQAIAMTPTNAVGFVNGVWTGNLAVLQPGTNVVLLANDGAGHTGLSNPFNVVAVPRPGIAGFSLSGTSLVINGTNGLAGWPCYVLMSTNATLPLIQWVPIATNLLSTSGSFTLTATNAVSPTAPRCFYILEMQ